MSTTRYPVYVISKGRSNCCLTARNLLRDETPFRLVVEPQEFEAYASEFDPSLILVLPFSNLGLGSIPARNWVWEHSIAAGHERHWILDDNMHRMLRMYRGHRVRCNAGLALSICEDFIDRFENVAVGGLNYRTFLMLGAGLKAFTLNAHVYSCLLIKNDLPYRWRGRYNEDTDLCLQVLSGGYCTMLINAFLVAKAGTMTMTGGNSTHLYQGDGRLKMARSLERVWPGVVTTKRRFSRPQHVVKGSWRYFDTPLRLKDGVDLSPKDYGMQLVAVRTVKSEKVRQLVEEYGTQ